MKLRNLINRNKRMNKKGQIAFDLIILIIVIFVILAFFAGWKFMTHKLAVTLGDVGIVANDVNMSKISNDILGEYDDALNMLQYVALAIFFGSILSIFVHNYLIKVNPFFFVVYFILSIVVVIFAAMMSNAYVNLLPINELGELYNYTMMNYIMIYLPYIMTVVCFIGLILLFVNYDKGQGGGGIGV